MRLLKRGWHELTRPRSLPPRARRRIGGRRTDRRSGIALLVAVTTMLILSVVVSELAYISRVRFLIAYHQRDKAQAYWLARSGVNIYTLILVADKQIGKQLDNLTGQASGAGLELPGIDSLWQMLPAINTGLMRMLFASGGASAGVDDIDEEQLQEFQQTGQVSDEVAEASRGEGSSLFSDRTFLDFEGDFSAEVSDHESKVDVNMFAGEDGPITDSATGQYLFALMSGEESEQWLLERNLDRWELIGNLRDWVDANNTRDAGLGGYEDSLYNNLEPHGYLAKNAKFDSIDEIRLVEGWQDEVFDQYGQYLTIFANGKANPNNWDERQHAAAISQASGGAITYEQAVTLACLTPSSDMATFTLYDFTYKNKKDYIQQVNTNCGIELDASKLTLTFTERSSVFTIKSTGLVGTSAVTITTVIDFSSTNLGKTRYWRVE